MNKNITELAREKALEIGLVEGEDFISDGVNLQSILKEALDKLLESFSEMESQNLMSELAPPDDNLDSGRYLIDRIEREIGEPFFHRLAERWKAKFQLLSDEDKAYHIRRVFGILSIKFPDLEVSYAFYRWLYQNVCDRNVIYRVQHLDPPGSEELEAEVMKDILASAGGDPDMVILLDEDEGCVMREEALPFLTKIIDL